MPVPFGGIQFTPGKFGRQTLLLFTAGLVVGGLAIVQKGMSCGISKRKLSVCQPTIVGS